MNIEMHVTREIDLLPFNKSSCTNHFGFMINKTKQKMVEGYEPFFGSWLGMIVIIINNLL